ncbi:MAG: hypothetical protein ACE5ES_00750 [Candidatus Nanoarchaeia archaeon]
MSKFLHRNYYKLTFILSCIQLELFADEDFTATISVPKTYFGKRDFLRKNPNGGLVYERGVIVPILPAPRFYRISDWPEIIDNVITWFEDLYR